MVVQWLRIHLPMQGTQIGFPIREDSTCCGAKPMCHNYWAHVPEPESCNTEACTPRAHAPEEEKPLQWEACALQLESSPRSLRLEKDCMCSSEDPAQKLKK